MCVGDHLAPFACMAANSMGLIMTRSGPLSGLTSHAASGDARRCGLATPRQDGQHASDVVAEFVHEVWSGPKSGKRSLAYYLAIEETGISQIDIAISYLLFTSAARFERLCQVLTDTKPPVPDGD